MANLNWVPNVGYILDQAGTQKILAYYGSLVPKFNAQVQLTAVPQQVVNPYGSYIPSSVYGIPQAQVPAGMLPWSGY